ncbi:MAG TPA: MFS transporter [Anaerolineae bacterium]|nr:MFS transporter [Anaerolineae bacterium]
MSPARFVAHALRDFLQDLFRLNRDLRLLASALLIWGIGEGIFFYYQPLYLAQWGASPEAIGGILGLGGLMLTLSHLPAGWLADGLGRRQLMWASWGAGLLAAWLMALAPSLTVFALGVVFYYASGFVMAPMNSYITAARGPLSVGRALTLLSATFNLGAILGPVFGSLLVSWLHMRGLYLISAVLFLISTLTVLFLRPQPVHPQSNSLAALRRARPPRAFVLLIGLTMLTVFAAYLPQPLAPNFLVEHRQVALPVVGRLGALSRLGLVVLNVLVGGLDPRWGYLLAQGALASFALLVWQGQGMVWYALAFFLMGGQGTIRSLSAALARPLVSEAHMGLAYGLMETANGLPLFLAPLLAGWLYGRYPEALWSLSFGALLALMLGTALWLFRTPAFVPSLHTEPAPGVSPDR